MKPELMTHKEYQNFVVQQLQNLSSHGDLFVVVPNDWRIISTFLLTDLSDITLFLRDSYSTKGPRPRDPASMLRAFLLFLKVAPTIGITKWVDHLNRTPLYAVMSGFDPKDVPGVGTFYDFSPRLWGCEENNTKPSIQPQRKKKKKSKKKKGEKEPPKNPNITKKLVKRIIRENLIDKKKPLPTDQLFDVYQSIFLEHSAALGLLGVLESLGIIGDGTPVETARYPRSKPTCDCRAKGLPNCHHPRYYSQPDCNSGWDSSRERYFNGYTLYMLSASNSPNDLPLYPKLQPASRHDSVSLIVSSIELKQRATFGTINKIILDSAHDAEALYVLAEHLDMEPFIDLNPRTEHNFSTDSDIQISSEGIPICPAGLEMKSNGFDKSRNRHKRRCPLASGTNNSCENPCSTAKYGRTFHTFQKDNPRLFPKTPRISEAFKETYKRRTSVERSNKREKVDYRLEAGRNRSTAMWYMRIYGIMMCQHMDAWYTKQGESLHLQELILPVEVA